MTGKFIHGATAETQEFDWGFFRWVSRPQSTAAKSLVVCSVHVYPGKGHNFHRHPEQEEVIHVLDGEMEQWVGKEKKLLGPGDSVFIPRDAVHASFTVGRKTLKVVAILGPAAGEEGYQLIDVSGEAPWNTLRPGR